MSIRSKDMDQKKEMKAVIELERMIGERWMIVFKEWLAKEMAQLVKCLLSASITI